MNPGGDVPQIEADDADRQVAGGALLLDVREPDEWAAGHAPAARHLPMGEVPASYGDLPEGIDILVICRTGARSQQAAEFLRAQGRSAANVSGGMRSWMAQGLPVVAADGFEGVVI